MPIFEDRSAFVSEVEEELAKMESSATSRMRSLLIVGISLVAFVAFQLVSTSISGVLILIVVLFVHESGHLIAMKLSGYRDVKMFFIPLFGAAVSGSERVPSGTRRAIVALSGPVPGICIGVLCVVLFGATRTPLFKESARTFLILNGFNLLPFVPLDGGHFMEAVLFSRVPILKAAFNVLAGIALAILAWVSVSIFFGMLAFFILRSVPFSYSSARLAKELKHEFAGPHVDASAPLTATGAGQIPSSYIERLIPFIELYIPDAHRTPKSVAQALRSIWSMIWFEPPSVVASAALLIAYSVCLAVGVVATVAAELAFRHLGALSPLP